MKAVPIGDLVVPISKKGPSPGSATFTYVDLSSVDAASKRIVSPAEVATGEAPSRARQNLRTGDVLVSTVRPNLNGVATVGVRLDGAVGSTGFAVLRADRERLSERYLFHWIRTPQFVETMTRLATGASYPAVSDAIVKSSRIPLPPLPEQRRLAAILDEADALRSHASRISPHLQQLRQQALRTTISEGGEPQPLATVVTRIDSGKSVVGSEHDSKTRVLKISAVTSGDFREDEAKALPIGYDAPPDHFVHKGDLLVSRANTEAPVGASVYVWDEPTEPRVLPDKLWRLTVREVHPLYLQAVIADSAFRTAVSQWASGSGGAMKNIGQRDFLSIPVSLGSREGQMRFVSLVEELRQREVVATARTRQFDSLFASLQHRAFRGEL